jgi:orotidine-5'-phosphate decarboxylase
VAGVHAADRLEDSIRRTGTIACVGLDPRPDLLPPGLRRRHRERHGPGPEGVAAAFREFDVALIDAVAGRCAAIKPQSACYEAYGAAGFAALEATIAHADAAGIPVILDAKRADIGSTSRHYGQMAFGGAPGLDGESIDGMGASWMTVNPYLGSDGVLPVTGAGAEAPGAGRSERAGPGLFVLVKTSNPSSDELQDRPAGDATVAELVADLVHGWGADRIGEGGLSDIGAVVGATYPDHARRLRERMPDTFFLVPGYGSQGAAGLDALAGLREDGRGIIVSSSRAICGAWRTDGTEDWAGAAKEAVDAMNRDLETARG